MAVISDLACYLQVWIRLVLRLMGADGAGSR
jgi:hypothetical protein